MIYVYLISPLWWQTQDQKTNVQVEKRGNNRRDLLGCFFSGAGTRTCLSLKLPALTLSTLSFFLLSANSWPSVTPSAIRIRKPDILWLCLHELNIHRVAFSPTGVYELVLAITADGVTSDDELLMTGSRTITLLETTNGEQKLFQQCVTGCLSCCMCKYRHKQHKKKGHRKIMSELLTPGTTKGRQEGRWQEERRI